MSDRYFYRNGHPFFGRMGLHPGGGAAASVFQARGGERCITLASRWSALLGAIAGFGEVAVIAQNRHLRLLTAAEPLEMQEDWEAGLFVDAATGLILDSRDWLYAIAVQERFRGGCSYGIQFFDRRGRGQFKVVLLDEEQLESFVATAEAFGVGGLPPEPEEEAAPPAGSLPLEQGEPLRESLRTLWKGTRHSLGGFFFPGLEGVPRLWALERVGRDLAAPLSEQSFLSAILFARRMALPLRVTLLNRGLHHTITLVPRAIERCPHGVHLFDDEAECHLHLESHLLFWAIQTERGSMIEIITAEGERIGLVEGAGTPEQQATWKTLLKAGRTA